VYHEHVSEVWDSKSIEVVKGRRKDTQRELHKEIEDKIRVEATDDSAIYFHAADRRGDIKVGIKATLGSIYPVLIDQAGCMHKFVLNGRE
jgi:hypothetical protein